MAVDKDLYFRGYKFAPKGKGQKAAIEPGNVVWAEEDVVNVAYKAARSIYRKYSWASSKYSEEDFIQDAAMSILKCFRDGYFTATTDNIYPIVYRLIDGYFVYNKLKKQKAEKCVLSLNDLAPFSKYGNGEDIELLETIADSSEQIIDNTVKERDAQIGKNILLKVIDTFETMPVRTRKHSYNGITGVSHIELSEYSIARLILDGNDLHDILNVFGFDISNSGSTSQTAYIAKIVKNVTDSLIEKIRALSSKDKESIADFLELAKRKRLAVI